MEEENSGFRRTGKEEEEEELEAEEKGKTRDAAGPLGKKTGSTPAGAPSGNVMRALRVC